MRKRRAVIYDDDFVVLDVLTQFFEQRGYEVLTFQEPVACPIVENQADCLSIEACADILLTDFNMLRMNGIELLKVQGGRGCKLSINNKALMSGYEDVEMRAAHELGCAFFKKPFDLDALSAWLTERELQMDLSRPLVPRRKEKRHECKKEVTFINPLTHEAEKAIAVNMSPSGLCLKTAVLFREEQSVTLHFSHPDLSRTASVRWVREGEDGFYLVGMNFTD